VIHENILLIIDKNSLLWDEYRENRDVCQEKKWRNILWLKVVPLREGL